jgi:hypothetical protein
MRSRIHERCAYKFLHVHKRLVVHSKRRVVEGIDMFRYVWQTHSDLSHRLDEGESLFRRYFAVAHGPFSSFFTVQTTSMYRKSLHQIQDQGQTFLRIYLSYLFTFARYLSFFHPIEGHDEQYAYHEQECSHPITGHQGKMLFHHTRHTHRHDH